jgi:hypothetical protein
MTTRHGRLGGTDFGHVNPMRDDERILGQIERGEVIAGPAGARIIASHAQEAYGDVWDRAWTDAVTAAVEAGEDCD